MAWLTVAVVVGALLAVAWWWLERPLYHRCPDPSQLESFIGDLVSEQSPWPTMELYHRGQCVLSLERLRDPSGLFDIALYSTGDTGPPSRVGPTSSANLGAAAQLARAALEELGIPAEAPLKVRYTGALDKAVLARARRNS